MFAPEHTAAFAEMILDTRHRTSHCLDYKEAAAYVKRTEFIGQSNGLFRRQVVTTGIWIVFSVTTGGLIDKPFPHVTFVSVCTLGQLGRRLWTSVGHCFVQSQFLPDIDQR